MWKVFRELDGSLQEVNEEVSLVTRQGQTVTVELVRDAVLEALEGEEIPTFRFIEKEVELSREMNGLPGRDAIAIWSRNIAESPIELGSLNPESVTDIGEETPSPSVQERVVFEDDALKWQFGTNGNYDNFRTIAWHDKTLVVIRVPEEYQDDSFILEYIPEDNETLPLAERYQGESIAFVEWRGYLGSNSFVCDFISKFRQEDEDFITTLKTKGKGKGFYVGMVARALYGDPPGRFEHDLTSKPRLWWYAARYRQLAENCPRLDLDKVQPFNGDCCIVFVHGAFSCGLDQLNLLYPKDKFPNRKPPVHTYRFEHDTFRSIPENANKLRKLILDKIKCKHLLLIGYSRGGLVCRIAARLLDYSQYKTKPEIWTYGTPHQGTVLVNLGSNLLKYLHLFVEKIEKGISVIDVPSAVFRYVIAPLIVSKFENLPKGIIDMSPSSTLLEMLNFKPIPSTIRSYGGNYHADISNGSKIVFGDDVIDGIFLNNPNDKIVTQESATAVGIGENTKDNCAHSGYFKIDRLRNKIYFYCHSCSLAK
ncbi:MAG: hypothetical protein QNJ55_23970 [Xenococcus sp. MO_188.B8]|nr:hypothetical protein [Xenococcus sp. MO_188.B8]